LKLNTAEEEEKKREGELGTTTLEKDRGIYVHWYLQSTIVAMRAKDLIIQTGGDYYFAIILNHSWILSDFVHMRSVILV
jgi:hypothetical protein